MGRTARWSAVGVIAAVSFALTTSSAAASPVWPTQGQASYVLGAHGLRSSPHQHAVPIASLAKIMTALLVLQASPLGPKRAGFTLTVRQRDVDDAQRRAADGESYVPVRRGEVLTERQALAALLLPSANNVAIMLARRVGRTVPRFVARMNAEAARLRLPHTHYTDPSGLDAGTVSTAADQTRLTMTAMRVPWFAYLVGRSRYRIPVAGEVHNYDTLLGHNGFVGVKTGSDSAAGGCFAFRSRRSIAGRTVTMTGVVLGQRNGEIIAAALAAARRLVDRVAPHAAS